MHALYQLQDELALDNQVLHISPLSIYREAVEPSRLSTQLADECHGAVKDYYLDWKNFTVATEETVDDLLSDFWQRFHNPKQVTEALNILELVAPVTWSEIQTQYRRLAAQMHPDKGGEAEDFSELRRAYEVLKRYY